MARPVKGLFQGWSKLLHHDYKKTCMYFLLSTDELFTMTPAMYIKKKKIDFNFMAKVVVSVRTTRGHCSSVGEEQLNLALHITAVIIKLQILLFPTIIQLTEEKMLPVKCRGSKTCSTKSYSRCVSLLWQTLALTNQTNVF